MQKRNDACQTGYEYFFINTTHLSIISKTCWQDTVCTVSQFILIPNHNIDSGVAPTNTFNTMYLFRQFQDSCCFFIFVHRSYTYLFCSFVNTCYLIFNTCFRNVKCFSTFSVAHKLLKRTLYIFLSKLDICYNSENVTSLVESFSFKRRMLHDTRMMHI